MNDETNTLVNTYRFWKKSLIDAGIPEKFWIDQREAIVSSLHGDALAATDVIFDNPDKWVRNHFVIIDGFAGGKKNSPDDVRRIIGMSSLIAGMSYMAIGHDFNSNIGRYVDFPKMVRQDLLNFSKERLEDACIRYVTAEILFVSEMTSSWSLATKALNYAVARVDEIIRARIDEGKTTIISFSNGCEDTIQKSDCCHEIRKILNKNDCAKCGSCYMEDERIIKMTTSPRGVVVNKGEALGVSDGSEDAE